MYTVKWSSASCRGSSASCTFFSQIQDGRRSVHPGFSLRAPQQQLILARLPPYIDVRYSVPRLGTFGHVS